MLSIKQWNNKTSDIKLVSFYSTIKMMHGPINIRFITVSSALISSRTSRYLYKTSKAICHKSVKHKDFYFYWSMTTCFGLHSPSSGHYYKSFKTRENRVRLHSYYGFQYFILYAGLCNNFYILPTTIRHIWSHMVNTIILHFALFWEFGMCGFMKVFADRSMKLFSITQLFFFVVHNVGSVWQ